MTAEAAATPTMAPEPSLKRLRALSNELESILFSELDRVVVADRMRTNSAAASKNEGGGCFYFKARETHYSKV